MLIPTFRLELENPILHRLVCAGKFDGKHPALAVATSSDSILIYSPHCRSEMAKHESRTLSINRTISAVACGTMNDKEDQSPRDILLVGTHGNLLAYDAEKNADIFFNDVQDGVNALLFGVLPGNRSPLTIVGGNCSIIGFDSEGEEAFWTTTGDNVSSLGLRLIDNVNQLMVGSEDHKIRIYNGDKVIYEVCETGAVVGLTNLRGTTFGYATDPGTVGVYNNTNRVWKATYKHRAQAIAAFDLDADGVNELIAGWSNGRLEVRNAENGDLIYDDRFPSSISAIKIADYRMKNRDEVIVTSLDGEVRGYVPAEPDQQGNLMDVTANEKMLEKLYKQRQQLIVETKNHEENIKLLKLNKRTSGMINPATNITFAVKPSKGDHCLKIEIDTHNDAVIKLVMVFCDVLFDQGKLVSPNIPMPAISIPIRSDKNIAAVLDIKAVVGQSSSSQDHVFEKKYTLPKFSRFFVPITRRVGEINPKGSVTFDCQVRVNRIKMWLDHSFHWENSSHLDNIQKNSGKMNSSLEKNENCLNARFVSIVNREPLAINVTAENITIQTNTMELGGEVMQDLCKFLKITDIGSVVSYPGEMDSFEEILQRVEHLNAIRLRLSTEIADSSQLLKTLVIKAEDSRILNDIPAMMRHYAQLENLNRELMGEYNKRANNHAELLKNLKEVNHMIQKASKLRMGQFSARVVQACRKAIKTHRIQSLFKIIKYGDANSHPNQ